MKDVLLLIPFILIAAVFLPYVLNRVFSTDENRQDTHSRHSIARLKSVRMIGRFLARKQKVRHIDLTEESYGFGETVYEMSFVREDQKGKFETLLFTESEFKKVQQAMEDLQKRQNVRA